MKKAIALVAICLLACSSLVWADDAIGGRTPAGALPGSISLPNVDRTGSCTLSLFDPAAGLAVWGPSPGEGYALYLDPAVDQDTATCSPAFYPYHISSVDIPLFIQDMTSVGFEICYTVEVVCPGDAASPGVTRDCKAPYGAVLCSAVACHTVTETDSADGIFNLSATLDCCVDAPFFLVVRYLGAWGGAPATPPSILLQYPTCIANQQCRVWFYGQLGLGGGLISDFCWFANQLDINFGAGVCGGPWVVSVNGEAGQDCDALSCAPCVRTYPGDDPSSPIIINTAPWSGVVDLCDFCSDYDQRVHDGIPGGSFTGNGPDAVLELSFDVGLPEACFTITLTNLRPSVTYPFRIRSWVDVEFSTGGSVTLNDGNPRFPGFGGGQTYNFTNAGAVPLGCVLPDFDGDGISDRYLLYLDTRNCCASVQIDYAGDTPLPVDLVSFGAIAGDGQVQLTWQTASELSVEAYEITRNDEPLTEVQGLGDSPTGHTYTYVDREVINGIPYTYRLSARDNNGAVTHFSQTETAIPVAGIVTEYSLQQNYPNPFNPSTSISYAVKDAGLVSLKVFTIDGREVATLVNDVQQTGAYTVDFDGNNLASGVYLYKLEVNGFNATHKMVLMK